jgi:hypothetical protein
MSHFAKNNIQENCMSSRVGIEDWQYGQPFPTALSALWGRQFLVEPIACAPQAIMVSVPTESEAFRKRVINDDGVQYHVFTKWITTNRVDEWKKKRNWDAMVASGNYAMEGIDPLSVRMFGSREVGFKYRVNCDEQGVWTCTCKHFEHNNTECCKHINACVDAVVWKESLLVDDRGLGWRPYATTFNLGGLKDTLRLKDTKPLTYLGYTDIVEEVDTYLPSESQFHQFQRHLPHARPRAAPDTYHQYVTNHHSFNK